MLFVDPNSATEAPTETPTEITTEGITVTVPENPYCVIILIKPAA